MTLKTRLIASVLLFTGAQLSFAKDLPTEIAQKLKMDSLSQAAPELPFVNKQGKVTHLYDYRGRAILLHLWASWCIPCQKELPELSKFAESLDKKRWAFIPISVDREEDRKKAENFLNGMRPRVSFFQALSSKELEKYKTWGLPVTYIINPQGEITARALGKRDWLSHPELGEELNRAFNEASPSPTQNK